MSTGSPEPHLSFRLPEQARLMRYATLGQLGVLGRSLLERDRRVLAKAMSAQVCGSTFLSHSSRDDQEHVAGAMARARGARRLRILGQEGSVAASPDVPRHRREAEGADQSM